MFAELYLYILDMWFKSDCSNCGEAWLGPSSMGEKACDPMWSSSCNPLWWRSTYAGKGVRSKYWRNVWKIWNGSSWFCFNCPGSYTHTQLTLPWREIFLSYSIHYLSKEMINVPIRTADNWCKGEAPWIHILIFLASVWSMNLKLKNRWVKTNMTWETMKWYCFSMALTFVPYAWSYSECWNWVALITLTGRFLYLLVGVCNTQCFALVLVFLQNLYPFINYFSFSACSS